MATIAQISDTHIDAGTFGARARLDDLARTVAAINALVPRPLAVIHTGDVAHNGEARDYAAAREVLAALRAPLYAIPGNRDRRAPFRDAFAADGYLAGQQRFIQYEIDLGPLRLVALDSCDDQSGLGAYCGVRRADLERRLVSGGDKPTLVAVHHPPVPIPALPRQPLQFRDAGQAELLRGAIAGSRSVVGVIAGHVHRSDSVELENGARVTTMPSIAVDLRREKTPYGYTARTIYHLHQFDGRSLATASVIVDISAAA